MDDLDRLLVSRRQVVQGALLGAAGPVLWVRPGLAATPATGTHLTFGADAAREVTVSWSTEGTVARPALELGTTTAYGTLVGAETRPVRGTSTTYHHARLTGLIPATTYRYR